MDMLFPGSPIQQGPANNYTSPLRNSVTPSINETQNAMDMEKSSMVPDEEKVRYRSKEDADGKQKKRKKKQNEQRAECNTCKKRRTQLIYSEARHIIGPSLTIDPPSNDNNSNGLNGDDKDVISRDTVFRYSYCAECGKPYISPGSLSAVTRAASAKEKLGAQYQTGYVIMPRGASINTEV